MTISVTAVQHDTIVHPQLSLVDSALEKSIPAKVALSNIPGPSEFLVSEQTDSQGPFRAITQSDAVKDYAAFLIAQSWCIDTSKIPVRPFHSRSNLHATIDHLCLEFAQWARRNCLKVDGKYGAFIQLLEARLPSLLPRVLGTAFRPEPVAIFDRYPGIPYANTYVPFRPVRVTGMPIPPIFREYLDRLFQSRADEKAVLDWCAHMIQKPMVRPEFGIILTGDHGTGKSSLVNVMRFALGGHHVWQRNQYSLALENFSQVLPDNLLVCFDDAPDERGGVYEKLKLVMSAKELSVNVKFVQNPILREVYARVIICTNQDKPFDFGQKKDRRFYVCEPCIMKVDLDESKAFFKEFYAWMGKPETAEYLYNFFKDRDISSFEPGSTTQTAALKRMLGEGDESLEDVCSRVIAKSPVFHEEQLRDALLAAGYKSPETADVTKVLKKLAYKRGRRAVPGCQAKQIYVWQPAALRNRSLSPDEIAALQGWDRKRTIRCGYLMHGDAG